jgi:glycerol-3-phosphate acyltransferase PlsX
MKIVVDAMGGDYAPSAIVEGVVDAVNEYSDVTVALVGIRDKIDEELKKHSYPGNQIEIISAPDVIEMNEPATVSIRTKKDSSISIGIKHLKEESYDAFISAGNTGAVVCAATVYLGMLPGIDRPGIGLVIPTLKRVSFLIDVGANTDPKPVHLMQSALMAKIYAQKILNIPEPQIGLLNIGTEATKGTDFVKETHKLFTEKVDNFIGNIEPNDIFKGVCECIICDGFAGNIVIKVAESLMESAASLIRREIKKSPVAFLGAILMKSRLNHIKKYADYTEYGGAPLLGVNGLVMISHGRSSPKAIKNAIRAAKREIDNNLMATTIEEISKKQ